MPLGVAQKPKEKKEKKKENWGTKAPVQRLSGMEPFHIIQKLRL